MATAGKLPIVGFGAGSIGYVVLLGFESDTTPPSWTITTDLKRGGSVGVRVDSHGYLVVAPVAAGTPGSPKQIGSLALGTDSAGNGYLCVAQKTAGSLAGPLTPLLNLKVTNDNTGAFQMATKTAGSLASRLTPLANLRVRTDENGYLLVAYKSIGLPIGPVKPLLMQTCCTDENGYLLVVEAP